YFDSDATKSYEWRIDQLTRLENLCKENAEVLEAAMSSDFKTASQEKVFEIMAPIGTAAFAKQDLKEWMKPVDVVVPKALRESGHTAKVYREPYGVTLVIGPFNGPLPHPRNSSKPTSKSTPIAALGKEMVYRSCVFNTSPGPWTIGTRP
ncbi:MAG: aldehyde dehydrogenase family protein, partial [Silvibacterium sp.]